MAGHFWRNPTWLVTVMAVSAILALSILPLAGGCGRKPASVDAAPTGVRVSSAELFTGDAKRLEPHLGLTSGCVRLESSEPVFIGIEVELWQAGKAIKVVASGGYRVAGPTEASFSLQELFSPEGKPKDKLVLAVLGKAESSSRQWVTEKLNPASIAPNGTMSTVAKLERPEDLVQGVHAPVWAILAHDAIEARQFNNADHSLEDGPKQALWALVVKIWWEKDMQ